MPTVTHLEALEILDGRGRPSLAVACVLDEAVRGRVAIPGLSVPGPRQPAPLHDGDLDRYEGLGCTRAVALVDGPLRGALVGRRFRGQEALDRALLEAAATATAAAKATAAKAGPGPARPTAGNATLGVSLAFTRACALLRGVPLYRQVADVADRRPERLPRPQTELFGRGDGDPLDRGPLTLAVLPTGEQSLDEALSLLVDVRAEALQLLRARHGAQAVPTPAGALAAPFFDTDAALLDAREAVQAAGATLGQEARLVLGVQARLRHEGGWYRIDRERLTAREVTEQILRFARQWPLAVVEDPFHDEDWASWQALRARLDPAIQLLGRELTGADPQRIARAGSDKALDVVHLEPADLACLSDAKLAAEQVRKAGLRLVIGAGAAETEDDWLADLAVGLEAERLQIGGPVGAERTAKLNRLLAIAHKHPWPLAPG